jgi:hypothetical protein
VRDPTHKPPLPAELFTLLWETLAELLGTSATALLLRRAALRASTACPELTELTISRLNLEYRYTVPSAWQTSSEGSRLSLRALVEELQPLLVELTGGIAIRRLDSIAELREITQISEQERP